MKVALAQIDPTIGDFSGNTAKILDFTRRAQQGGADLVLFPELAICGYPPADLLEKPAFVTRCGEALCEIARATAHDRIAVIAGYVTAAEHGAGKHVMNSAALVRNGHVEFVQSKMLLPYYDVFDEQRYFAPARPPAHVPSAGPGGSPSPSVKTPGTTRASGRTASTTSIPSKS